MHNKLRELARIYGIQTSYLDMRHQHTEADEESLLLVLKALGAQVRGMDDVEPALARHFEEQADLQIQPVIVAWDGRLRPEDVAVRNWSQAVLVLEDGTTVQWPPPEPLPAGYHERVIGGHAGGQGPASRTLVISAPSQAYFPLSTKTWGLFAPVYALRSNRSSGAGDLTDFRMLIDWMQRLGGKVAATLPLLAAFLDEPFEASPYSPASRLYWNEFYVDPARVAEFDHSVEARRLAAHRLEETDIVDYRETMKHRRGVLEALARQFFTEGSSSRRGEFQSFLNRNPGAEDYARFRAVTEQLRKGWTAWPERLRTGRLEASDYSEDLVGYYLYTQWVVQQQLAELGEQTRRTGGLLYLDLPLGLHGDSYDTWRHPELFVSGVAVGAPPDPVFTTGQNWAFPPMHPKAMRLDRYRYTIEYIRNHLRFAKLLRIDHVMGLHRLFWIPDGLPGQKGVYVEYPAEELYAVFSVESHRYGAGLVGENLGVVPPEVTASMRHHNFKQLYVAQFETALDWGRTTLRTPPAEAVASLNTHDMFPFKAFLDGSDIPDRLDLGFLTEGDAASESHHRRHTREGLAQFFGCSADSTEQIFERALHFLGQSSSDIVLVNLEDLWQETNPQNIPATTTQRPNWRRRVRNGTETLPSLERVEKVLQELDANRPAST